MRYIVIEGQFKNCIIEMPLVGNTIESCERFKEHVIEVWYSDKSKYFYLTEGEAMTFERDMCQ